jgi:hypothetical protein
VIESYRKRFKPASDEPSPLLVNVTKNGTDEFRDFSPFRSVTRIDGDLCGVPNEFSSTVEGVWQGLKDIRPVGNQKDAVGTDLRMLHRTPSKRRVPKDHVIVGHRYVEKDGRVRNLSYREAHELIYLPAYAQQLDALKTLVERLSDVAQTRPLILLDYDTHPHLGGSKPLSHACLLKHWIERRTLNGYGGTTEET